MKYYVIRVSNGNFDIEAACSSINQALVNFHSVCKTYWNEPTVTTGAVSIVDENLAVYDRYTELISHETTTE